MFRLALVPGKGRGLVASRPIPSGALIERAPGVRLNPPDRALVDRTSLFAYTFADPQTFGQAEHDCLIAFGALTFCNHSVQPNATVLWDSDTIGLWARLEALRDIAAGEEITLFYTNISEYSADDFLI